jgi:predicted metal-dependent hydrolase
MHRLLQLTFDFFDAAPVAPAAPVRKKARKTPPSPGSQPPAPRPTPDPGIQKIPDGRPAELLDQVLAPPTFRHPRANREVLIGETVVAFQLRRGKRRTIGFAIGAEGLAVSAPGWVPLYEVDEAVRGKSEWILKKLGEASERHRRVESTRIEWKDGAVIPFLGEPVVVRLDPGHRFSEVGGVLETQEGVSPLLPDRTHALPDRAHTLPDRTHTLPNRTHTLRVGLPHTATADQIRDTVQAWLMRQAKRLVTERLDHFAPMLGVRYTKLVLSSAGTRWGTAHSDGTIRLNWRLVHFRLPVIDYVVAHELSHLRVMDHSPRFWETVSSVVPDYAQLRGQLKDEHLPPW